MNLSNYTNPPGLMRQTLSAQAAGTKLRGRCMASATKSLELLRLNIQKTINKEIDAILNKYLVNVVKGSQENEKSRIRYRYKPKSENEVHLIPVYHRKVLNPDTEFQRQEIKTFFKPAIENIRNNLGENSISEDTVRTVCRQILEDAKIQYYSAMPPRKCSPYNDSECESLGDKKLELTVPQGSVKLFNQRKESEGDFEASQSIGKLKKKPVKSGSNAIPNVQGPLKLMKFENIKRVGPKWDPNRVVKSTLFIMGARANKVLGFGQTRGRLYTKHPELLKYSGDAEDKEWLSRHNLIPPTGGIAYLLILEDVKELAESDEYRHNPNVLLGDLKGFQAPDFMLNKIRAFMLQTRSKDKDRITFTYFDDPSNRVDGQFRVNYDTGWDSQAKCSPPTVPGSATVEHPRFANGSKSFLVPVAPQGAASSRANDLLYDGVAFTGSSEPN